MERISLQFFPVYDPLAIYRVTCRNLDLESTGRSFFNCDVRFAAKEFSKGKEGFGIRNHEVVVEKGWIGNEDLQVCRYEFANLVNDRIYNKKEIGNA